MIDLSFAFRIVANALDATTTRYVVVGSTAAAVWGVLRATRDIDIVTVVDVDGGRRLLQQLDRPDLYVPLDDALEAVAAGGTFNVLHPTSGGKIDVFVRTDDDDFTQSRLGRRITAQILGVRTWVATPEDVILAKLKWRFDSRSEVQWRDCVEIAATQTLDTEYMRRWADRLGVVKDLTDLLGESGR